MKSVKEEEGGGGGQVTEFRARQQWSRWKLHSPPLSTTSELQPKHKTIHLNKHVRTK